MTGRPSPPADERPVVAIDPGRDKCGLAVVFSDGRVAEHSVVPRPGLMAAVREAVARHQPVAIVIGNRTGSRDCRRELTEQGIGPIVIVEEHETTQRARARYFRDNPPRGWRRLAPIGMLTPLRPVDDYAAILLAEAYWEGRKGGRG